jgi:SH3 domain-containing YSC84-like protein 1
VSIIAGPTMLCHVERPRVDAISPLRRQADANLIVLETGQGATRLRAYARRAQTIEAQGSLFAGPLQRLTRTDQNPDTHPATPNQGRPMNSTRQSLTLASAAIALAAACSSLPAHADDASDARAVVDKATVTVNTFAKDRDYASLPALISKAKGVLVYPQILEGGFIIGGSGGTGVLLVRDEQTGNFSAPAFYTMGGLSIGLLAGGQAAEVMLLINSQKALDSLLSTKVKLGAGVSVAVGPKGGGQGATASADIVSYSRAKGAYAGMSLEGQVIDVRDSLNAAYYGKPTSPVDILVRKSVSNPGAGALQAALKSIGK